MNDVLEQNLAVLTQRWPAVAARLDAEPLEALDGEFVEGSQVTLSIRGIQLTSRHDREAEARQQADTFPPEAAELHVYGPALGDLPRVLLGREPLRRLRVYILNGALFAMLLEAMDHSDWLADPRVELAYADSEGEIRLPFFAMPSELVLADVNNARIRDRLISEMHLAFNNQDFSPSDPALQQRIEANAPYLAADADVSTLFGSLAGREVYLIATGPSLERHFEALREAARQVPRPLFICVDTAYRPLHAQGIAPDVVVSIDQRIGVQHLPQAPCAAPTLVYMPLLAPQVLAHWHGRRLAAYSTSPVYQSAAARWPHTALHTGGSVIHPALDLAVRMGAARVTLFGADFAFPGGKTHAGWNDGELGAPVANARHWVLDGHGRQVRTQLNFRSYLIEVERYIAAHPEVKFFNTSRSGAMIAGTTFDERFARD
ncbi:6-hydroxymethylpterin diphosphokinase MptE-like protein [Pseudomonas sp. NPDC007930]|uniref:motility associated factor glycosyltransferase family protein n=1 Tax=Pseudomonas sp. NPDC007930 TaxID=3364417 RepID=UPI0036EC9A1E